MLVCVFACASCARDRGCSAHPVFPAPSILWGVEAWQTSGASRREIAVTYSVVHVFLRPPKQMDDPRRRDGDEHEARQMMSTDENRVDMQRQRQHGVHRARRERYDDVG